MKGRSAERVTAFPPQSRRSVPKILRHMGPLLGVFLLSPTSVQNLPSLTGADPAILWQRL